MANKICIAGKNNIAVAITEHLLTTFPNIEILFISNKSDTGENGFQRSFKLFCNVNRIREVTLKDVYSESDLIFLSLEFDTIINPSLFLTSELFNIHFSLLPEYKGMYTSALPILEGKFYSGVTLHKIDEGIDTGDIIAQTKFEIDDEMTAEQLYGLYVDYGAVLIKENLSDILNNSYIAERQQKALSSYNSKKRIDYNNLSINHNATAFQIKRQINAFVFATYQLPIVKGYSVYKSKILDERSKTKPGEIITSTPFFIDISTIDYNLRIYKDLRKELFEIAQNGEIERLKLFIEQDYDLKQKSERGWDIAIVGAYNDQFGFLKFLIEELSWNVNSTNYNGTTLAMYLMTRVSQGVNSDYFETFIRKADIDLSIRDYNQCNLLDYAMRYNLKDSLIELIRKYSK
ncbi:MAG: formyl transferase [Bacteroidetes bacterium]|nr:formyl transferase [Bacteroidota bacterium]